VIALVSIALLGFFPGMSTDAKIAQSASYWSAARPFAVMAHQVSTGGTATITVQSHEASGTLTITAVNLGGGSNSSAITIAPGEPKQIAVTSVVSGTPAAGSVYDLGLNFTYTNAYGITGNKQYGAKNLVGKYV
jgi:hypothetical protein